MKNGNMMRAKQRIGFTLMASALLLGLPGMAAGGPPAKAAAVPPDLTQGGKKDGTHDWLLGPTGARGWIFGSSGKYLSENRW
jgi:hypothetical protein